jgi:hypothetical protein
MAQPPVYNRTKDFTENFGNETDHSSLNAELDSAANSINDIRTNIAILQADDGKLRPSVVTTDSISAALYTDLVNSAASGAATAADTATTKASEAAASATNAAASESAASTSASTATTKASEASTSATSAASSANTATTKASEAATSATNAATSETNAASSATSASGSATTATTKAGEAATSASNAATSASNAATSETNAASSASSAATSLSNFKSQYLGAAATAPTADGNGAALTAGDIYFDTTTNTMQVYTGSAWQAAAISDVDLVHKTGDETIPGVKTFSNGVILTSLNGGPLAGFRDKFIGGNFTRNPWQRGTSFTVTASGTYVADRWRVDFDGSANITVDKVALAVPQVINGQWCSFGLRFLVNSKSANTFIRLSQRIEFVDTLTTLPATVQTAIQGSASFSVPVNARQHFGTGGTPSADVITPLSNSLAVTSSLQLLATGLTVPTISGKTLGTAGNDFLGVEYDLMAVPATGHVIIPIAGIEPGTSATPFEGRPSGPERALCQRYYEVKIDEFRFDFPASLGEYFVRSPWIVPKRAAATLSTTVETNVNCSVFADLPTAENYRFRVAPTTSGGAHGAITVRGSAEL